MIDFAKPAMFGLAAALGFVAATSAQTCGRYFDRLNQPAAPMAGACNPGTSLDRGIGGTGIRDDAKH